MRRIGLLRVRPGTTRPETGFAPYFGKINPEIILLTLTDFPGSVAFVLWSILLSLGVYP